jgi:transcriptional regulator with XRE-family HTH domain
VILGEKVKELRKAKGWSQTELAKAAGVKQPTIVSIERGRQRTSKYSIKLANALGVNVREIDPDYVFGPMPSQLDADVAGLAYEVMLENLRPDLTPEGRQGSAIVFLDLAHTTLDADTDESRVQQLRDRLLQIYADHFLSQKFQ